MSVIHGRAAARVGDAVRQFEQMDRSKYNQTPPANQNDPIDFERIYLCRPLAARSGSNPQPAKTQTARWVGSVLAYDDVGDGTPDCWILAAGTTSLSTTATLACMVIDEYNTRPLMIPVGGVADTPRVPIMAKLTSRSGKRYAFTQLGVDESDVTVGATSPITGTTTSGWANDVGGIASDAILNQPFLLTPNPNTTDRWLFGPVAIC